MSLSSAQSCYTLITPPPPPPPHTYTYFIEINYRMLFQKLLDELENGDIPSHIREARLDHFKQQAQELQYLQAKGHGKYRYLFNILNVFNNWDKLLHI